MKTPITMRLALRDMRAHWKRSVVAVLLFALPIIAVVTFGSIEKSSVSYDRGIPTDALSFVYTTDEECKAPSEHSFPHTFCLDEEHHQLASLTPIEHAREVLGDQVRLVGTTKQSAQVMASQSASHPDRQPATPADSESDSSVVPPGAMETDLITVPEEVPSTPPRGSVILGSALAIPLHKAAGDTVTITVNNMPATFTIERLASGTATYIGRDAAKAAGWSIPQDYDQLFADPSANARFLNSQAEHQGVAISSPSSTWGALGVDEQELRQSGWSTANITDSSQGPVNSAVGSFSHATAHNLLSLIPIVLGYLTIFLFIVALTLPVFASAARRQLRTMGLLSVIGAAPYHVRRILLWMGAFTGVFGGALGIVLAYPVSRIIVPLTTTNSYIPTAGGTAPDGLAVNTFHFDWEIAVVGWLIAMVVGLAAALWPAVETSRTSPVIALGGGAPQRMPRFRRRMLVGPVFLALAAVLFIILIFFPEVHQGISRRIDGTDAYSGLTLLTVIIPLACLGFLFSGSLLTWLIGTLAYRLPVATRLAARDAHRAGRRTAPAIGAVAVTTLFATMFLMTVVQSQALDQQSDSAWSSGETYEATGPNPQIPNPKSKQATFIASPVVSSPQLYESTLQEIEQRLDLQARYDVYGINEYQSREYLGPEWTVVRDRHAASPLTDEATPGANHRDVAEVENRFTAQSLPSPHSIYPADLDRVVFITEPDTLDGLQLTDAERKTAAEALRAGRAVVTSRSMFLADDTRTADDPQAREGNVVFAQVNSEDEETKSYRPEALKPMENPRWLIPENTAETPETRSVAATLLGPVDPQRDRSAEHPDPKVAHLDVQGDSPFDMSDRSNVPPVIMTPQIAREAGLPFYWRGSILQLKDTPNPWHSYQVQKAVSRNLPHSGYRMENGVSFTMPDSRVTMILSAMAFILFTWLVAYVAVGLIMVLAAAESRRDLRTLRAIGATGGLSGRFLASQGLLVGLAGSLPATIMTVVAFALVPTGSALRSGRFGDFFMASYHSGALTTYIIGGVVAILLALVVPLVAAATGWLIGRTIRPTTTQIRED